MQLHAEPRDARMHGLPCIHVHTHPHLHANPAPVCVTMWHTRQSDPPVGSPLLHMPWRPSAGWLHGDSPGPQQGDVALYLSQVVPSATNSTQGPADRGCEMWRGHSILQLERRQP